MSKRYPLILLTLAVLLVPVVLMAAVLAGTDWLGLSQLSVILPDTLLRGWGDLIRPVPIAL